MQKYLPILLLCLLLGSCFKYVTADNNIQYTLQGFENITIDQNDSTQLYVICQLQSGIPANEYVTLKVSGIPDNVVVNTDSVNFRPSYRFRLAFYAHSPKPGVYPVTVTTTSPTVGTKQYTFNLTVTSLTDCTAQFDASPPIYATGSQHQAQAAGVTGTCYAFIIRKGCDTLNIQVMKDTLVPGDPDPELYPVAEFDATVNCSANTLTIYPQSAQWNSTANAMIRGAGSYVPVTDTTATTTINDTVYAGTQIVSVNAITIY